VRPIRLRLLASLIAVVSMCALLTVGRVRVVEASTTCAKGGVCRLGDVGPGGGIVFYAAPTVQWWGQYLEASIKPDRTRGAWDQVVLHGGSDAKVQRILGKAIGAGAMNTEQLVSRSDVWAMRQSANGWRIVDGIRFHIPSKDELDALYNFIATTKTPLSSVFTLGVNGQPFWTSSEASDTFAWYQLFQDGTQFTDANGIIRGLTGNKASGFSNVHTGSSFSALPLRFVWVRAFAPRGVPLPARPSIPQIPFGGRTSATCAAGVACTVGDIGPGGGVVFYDAGSRQSWGRWLEAAPAACEGVAKVWRNAAADKKGTQQLPLLYPKWSTAARQRVQSKAIGMGSQNTARIVKQHAALTPEAREATAAGYADALICGGRDDWFLPSKDELDSLYNVLALTDHDLTGTNAFGFDRGFYWTSSEYNNETAWTQYWIDGQQFDREKWLSANEVRRRGGTEDPRPFRVRPIRAFG